MKWVLVVEFQSNLSILPFILISMITLSKIVGISTNWWPLKRCFSRLSFKRNLSLLAHLRQKFSLYEVGFGSGIIVEFFYFAFYSYFHDYFVKNSRNIKKLVTFEQIFFRAFILAQSHPPSSTTSEAIAVCSWPLWSEPSFSFTIGRFSIKFMRDKKYPSDIVLFVFFTFHISNFDENMTDFLIRRGKPKLTA